MQQIYENPSFKNMIKKRINLLVSLILVGIFFLNCQKIETTPTPTTPVVVANADPTIGCTDAIAKNFKATANVEDCSCQYDFASKVSAKIPSDFAQKVLIEEFSGTWCGWCPIGEETLRKLSANKNIVGVEVHYGDALTNFEDIFTPLRIKYGNPAFPTGLVNRKKSVIGTTKIMGDNEWEASANAILKNTKTSNGLAIDSKLTGNSLEVLAHLQIKNSTEEIYGLGIYLVEDNVLGFPQQNYLSKDSRFSGYEAYNLPLVINDIAHKNVARTAISEAFYGVLAHGRRHDFAHRGEALEACERKDSAHFSRLPAR